MQSNVVQLKGEEGRLTVLCLVEQPDRDSFPNC